MSGFPTQVQTQPAPAVAGDFSSANPRWTVEAGQGQLVAGSNLFVGRFAWTDTTNTVANSNGSGTVTGFVGRNQQGLITAFLAESSMQVLPGTQCALFNGGDFWTVNSGTTVATIGMKAYANYATGLPTFAATATPPTGGTSTASTVSAQTFSVTGSIAIGNNVNNTGNEETGILTVTVVGSGTVVPGGAISGTGIQTGTIVTSQLTGTAGGVGTYQVNIPQTTASTTVSGTYGLLTIGGTVVSGYGVGDVISGTSVTAGSTITGLGTGVGGAGTYYTQTQTVGSTAINATSAIETKWVAMSVAQPGELIKISNHILG